MKSIGCSTRLALLLAQRASKTINKFDLVGFTAYAKTVPLTGGAVDVPERPGLGADPEPEMIERYKV